MIAGRVPSGTCGIGHTRWATHGAPSDVNSHPHMDQSGRVALVHNGIVENYVELKETLINEHGIKFKSETDSEVIAQLVGVKYNANGGDLEKAVYDATKEMRGTYAIGVIAEDTPNKIVAYRKEAPLIAGLGKKSNFIASDIPALLKYTNDIFLIENDEMVICTPDSITIKDKDGKEVKREAMKIT